MIANPSETVFVTPTAAEQLLQYQRQVPQCTHVRFGVSEQGDEFVYELKWVGPDQYDPKDDELVVCNQLNVIVNGFSQPYVQGTTIDWSAAAGGFIFENPNVGLAPERDSNLDGES